MKSNVTMQDIADRFGVSKVTVSKALNGKEGVSDELKQKIQEAAHEMGYRFNSIAKSLKSSATFNIGVLIAERFIEDNVNAFYMGFYQQISKALDEQGYSAILHLMNEEDEKELVLPRIYTDKKIDGLIILGQVSHDYIKLLKTIDIPVIFLDFYDENANIDAIIQDNFYGAYNMTNYVIKNGHKKVAFVGNIYSTSSIQDRFLGFYKSLLEHHIVLRDDYIISDRDEHGKFISIHLPEDRPTCFVCNCDQIAYKLIMQLKELGLKVPEDVSVTGFDNDIYATISELGITTVEVDMKEMSRSAVKRILTKINNRKVHFGRISIKGKIVERDSVSNLID